MRRTNLNKIILLIFIVSALQLVSNSSFAQTEPKIEGSSYEKIDYEALAKKVKKEDREKLEKQVKGPAPKVTGTAPKKRIRGNDLDGGGRTIYQFTNHDFLKFDNTCGRQLSQQPCGIKV